MSELFTLAWKQAIWTCDDEKGGRPYETGCFDF